MMNAKWLFTAEELASVPTVPSPLRDPAGYSKWLHEQYLRDCCDENGNYVDRWDECGDVGPFSPAAGEWPVG